MASGPIDRPAAVRAGQELPADRLAAYLYTRLGHAGGGPQPAGAIEILQYRSGYSNLTYLVRLPAADRELVIRRAPPGSTVRSAHDMTREHRILSALAPVFHKAPRPVLFCDDSAVIGAPFYAMEPVEGVILRDRLPDGLTIPPDAAGRLSAALVDTLAEIHGLDVTACGLSDIGRPAGYVGRQVEGWTKRYRDAETTPVPSLDRAARWLAGAAPAESGAALVHNDYKFDNLVLDPGDLSTIRAVLDWEMATVGDPLMDLGTSLGYWVDPDDPEAWQRHRFGLTTLPGTLSRRALVDRYAAVGGRAVGEPLFYYVFGLFKIAAIVQQIYKRHTLGLTRDPRFATLDEVVRACGLMASLAIERGRIDRLG